MSELSLVEFTEAPSDYLICSNPGCAMDVSCVIVEDDPGPYLDLVQDIVAGGKCILAMTAPFTDNTIRLLQGQPVQFGLNNTAQVQLPNLQHCVVILDMRNGEKVSTEQTFTGYNPKEFALCGFQFFKQLRGFPGKIFIATRYGRSLLDQQGISDVFGVVQLQSKMEFERTMPEEDKQKVLAALNMALLPFDVSHVYRIALRENNIDITFRGEMTLLGPGKGEPKKSGLALMAVIQAGGEGISDEDLARRIGYQEKEDDEPIEAQDAGDGIEACERDGSMVHELLVKLITRIKEGYIPGVTHEALCKRMGKDFASRTGADAVSVFHEVLAMCQDADPNFTVARLYDIFHGDSVPTGDLVLDKGEINEGFGVISDPKGVDFSAGDEKRIHFGQFIKINFSVIPRLQAELDRLRAEYHLNRAEGNERVAAFADTNAISSASEEKQRNKRELAVKERRCREIEEELKQQRAFRDQSYRKMKGRSNRPLAPSNRLQNYMAKLPKRILTDLKHDNKSPSDDLIKYLERTWIRRSGGVHCFTGKEPWIIDWS